MSLRQFQHTTTTATEGDAEGDAERDDIDGAESMTHQLGGCLGRTTCQAGHWRVKIPRLAQGHGSGWTGLPGGRAARLPKGQGRAPTDGGPAAVFGPARVSAGRRR